MCGSSAILAAGHFLLLAQKKVTKENGTLGAAPLAERGRALVEDLEALTSELRQTGADVSGTLRMDGL